MGDNAEYRFARNQRRQWRSVRGGGGLPPARKNRLDGFLGLTLAFLKQRPDLADLGPQGLAYLDALARPEPVVEIAIASTARAAGAFCSMPPCSDLCADGE